MLPVPRPSPVPWVGISRCFLSPGPSCRDCTLQNTSWSALQLRRPEPDSDRKTISSDHRSPQFGTCEKLTSFPDISTRIMLPVFKLERDHVWGVPVYHGAKGQAVLEATQDRMSQMEHRHRFGNDKSHLMCERRPHSVWKGHSDWGFHTTGSRHFTGFHNYPEHDTDAVGDNYSISEIVGNGKLSQPHGSALSKHVV